MSVHLTLNIMPAGLFILTGPSTHKMSVCLVTVFHGIMDVNKGVCTLGRGKCATAALGRAATTARGVARGSPLWPRDAPRYFRPHIPPDCFFNLT